MYSACARTCVCVWERESNGYVFLFVCVCVCVCVYAHTRTYIFVSALTYTYSLTHIYFQANWEDLMCQNGYIPIHRCVFKLIDVYIHVWVCGCVGECTWSWNLFNNGENLSVNIFLRFEVMSIHCSGRLAVSVAMIINVFLYIKFSICYITYDVDYRFVPNDPVFFDKLSHCD